MKKDFPEKDWLSQWQWLSKGFDPSFLQSHSSILIPTQGAPQRAAVVGRSYHKMLENPMECWEITSCPDFDSPHKLNLIGSWKLSRPNPAKYLDGRFPRNTGAGTQRQAWKATSWEISKPQVSVDRNRQWNPGICVHVCAHVHTYTQILLKRCSKSSILLCLWLLLPSSAPCRHIYVSWTSQKHPLLQWKKLDLWRTI